MGFPSRPRGWFSIIVYLRGVLSFVPKHKSCLTDSCENRLIILVIKDRVESVSLFDVKMSLAFTLSGQGQNATFPFMIEYMPKTTRIPPVT